MMMMMMIFFIHSNSGETQKQRVPDLQYLYAQYRDMATEDNTAFDSHFRHSTGFKKGWRLFEPTPPTKPIQRII
jgi:hypothetical protein